MPETYSVTPVPLYQGALPFGSRNITVIAQNCSASTPATPANWRSAASVRVIASPTRGIGVLAILTPDEAADAVLRVTSYLSGPASGALPARTVVSTAIIRGLAPLEV